MWVNCLFGFKTTAREAAALLVFISSSICVSVKLQFAFYTKSYLRNPINRKREKAKLHIQRERSI